MTVVRPGLLTRLYLGRLRGQWVQELLAGVGIATGVALVLAVQIANSSITASAREIVRGIAGAAQLQLAARGDAGVDARLVAAVRALPGVAAAAPVLEQRATVTAGGRRVAVTLVGLDRSVTRLGGVSPREIALLALPGVFITEGAAERLPGGSSARQRLIATRGRVQTTPVLGVIDRAAFGPLASGAIAVGSLARVQAMTGLPGRATRIFVRAQAGREREVRRALVALAGTEMRVAAVDDELDALAVAVAPNDQATTLFAAISALVGLLFATTAMLLTVPARRRMVAQLRLCGFRRGHVAQVVLAHAVALGLAASAVGVLAGIALAATIAQEPPGYLTFAFPLGTHRELRVTMAAAAMAAGTAAAALASLRPLADLRRGRPVDGIYRQHGEPGHALGGLRRPALPVVAVGVAALAVALGLRWPGMVPAAIGLLALATLLALPATLALVLALAAQRERVDRPSMVPVAVAAIRATELRALTLAATCAIAVCGVIALEGAHRNLLDGLATDYREYASSADIWISHPEDDLALAAFDARLERLERVPGVAEARPYFGGLLDLGDRRVWVIARPSRDEPMIPPSQIVAGDPATAAARVRAGGAVTLSRQLADALGVTLGESVTLPSPTGPMRARVAALTTNLGWGPGAIIMRAADYRRAWATDAPSAIEVTTAPDAAPAAVAARLNRALAGTGVEAQTVARRHAHANGIARQGLARLRQIAVLVVVAAALALAAAMAATVRDRRPQLAQLAAHGWPRRRIWSALVLEAGLLLAAGCAAGAVTGTIGHWLLMRWLAATTGYPAPWSWAPGETLGAIAAVTLVALAVVALPGALAARTSPRNAFDPA